MTTIFEALYVLALDGEEGDIHKSAAHKLEPILAGAILAELALRKRIEVRDQRIVVVDQTPVDHPILDIALYDILESTKARKLKYWINTLTYNKIIEEIAHHLVEQGILFRKKKHLWMVIPYNDGKNNNLPAQSALINRLRDIVLSGEESDLTEKVLLAFVYYGDLVKLVFKHGDRKTARKRIKRLVISDEVGTVLGETLDEIVAVACEPSA